MATTTFSEMVTNMVAVLSTLMLSGSNLAVKTISGESQVTEMYVKVRWPWFLMPLAIVICATALFTLTVLQSGNTRSFLNPRLWHYYFMD